MTYHYHHYLTRHNATVTTSVDIHSYISTLLPLHLTVPHCWKFTLPLLIATLLLHPLAIPPSAFPHLLIASPPSFPSAHKHISLPCNHHHITEPLQLSNTPSLASTNHNNLLCHTTVSHTTTITSLQSLYSTIPPCLLPPHATSFLNSCRLQANTTRNSNHHPKLHYTSPSLTTTSCSHIVTSLHIPPTT